MNDLDWVFNELVQWVFFNVLSKWDSIVRKGQDKVSKKDVRLSRTFYYEADMTLILYSIINSLPGCSADINKTKHLCTMSFSLWKNIYMIRKTGITLFAS